MKFKKNNKQKASNHSKRTIQKFKKKNLEAQRKVKNSDLGKPPNLKKITLSKPNIWAANEGSIRLLAFLLKQGRHFLLHLAGAKKTLENEDLLKQISKMKPLYDLLEQIHQTYLGFPQQQKRKERLIVFFFRNYSDINPHYDELNTLNNTQFQQNLDDIKSLLDNVFYRELHDILQKLDGEENNIQIQIQRITQDIVEQTNQLDELTQANTIAKNLFIQLLIEQENHNLQILKTIVEKQNQKQLLFMFKDFITQNSFRISEFIEQIVQIIQRCDLKKSIKTFQHTNYDENCFIQPTQQILVEENSIYLSD